LQTRGGGVMLLFALLFLSQLIDPAMMKLWAFFLLEFFLKALELLLLPADKEENKLVLVKKLVRS
jgi:hypothetical protein